MDELPAAADERHNNGIRFRVYRIRNATLVFWQEGRVVCVLISYGEPEKRSNSPSPKPSE